MKKWGFLLLAVVLCVCVVPSSEAAERYEIGADVAVKVDYLHFFDTNFKTRNMQDAVYVGAEFYGD